MKEKKIFEKDLKKLPVGSILIGLFVWLLDIKVGCVGVHQASYGGIISLAAPVCGTYFVVKLSQFIYELVWKIFVVYLCNSCFGCDWAFGY